jgi:hemerythrin
MHALKIAKGVHWVAIPEAELSILCGCPADSVKLLMKKGLILPVQTGTVTYETGPNAILLSDVPSQNEMFSNLAEFPILQMLYRQGMILPGHPGNTGRRPLLVGIASQVRSQAEYIFRGNYGLTTVEEMTAAGVSAEVAREQLRMKLWFAYGRIRPTEELLETRVVGDESVELRNGAFVRRTGFNVYEFSHGGTTLSVDLNLGPGERYPASYVLGYHALRREYFSVVHNGEGNGWDPEKPCMGSIVIYQGRIYLIDAGPNIDQSLTALGISVNEVEGIFHSHSHDDHFAGLTSLVRADHRIKYYATPLVRASVAKKLSALMGTDEAMFPRWFEVHDLAAGEWNDVNGLQVRPVMSVHPVETNIFMFRALWDGGWKTYTHLADIMTFNVLSKMAAAEPGAPGVTPAFAERFRAELLAPADLKKIDADGEPIHGSALDFRGDRSGRLIISHVAGELSDAQKEIGSNAVFGRADVLIPANVDYVAQSAFRYLSASFPAAPAHSVRMLANCPLVTFNAGSIIFKKGERPRSLYLILQGVAEVLDTQEGVHRLVTGGAIIGEVAAVAAEPAAWTIRASSYVTAVQIPEQLYLAFIRENRLEDVSRRVAENRRTLLGTWLFGEILGWQVERAIAAAMVPMHVGAGQEVAPGAAPRLLLVERGEICLFRAGMECERLGRRDFFGEDEVLYGTRVFTPRALTAATLMEIPASVLGDIPVVQWKLLQTNEKRMRTSARAASREPAQRGAGNGR